VTRDEQKDARRRRIVAAAEALVRETGSTDFSMIALARRAQFSVATLYNLLNSKSSVLYVLLNSSLDAIVSAASTMPADADPVRAAIRASDVAGDVFASDPAFLKPLYRYLLGVADPLHRPAFMARALHYWETHLGGLDRAGLLPTGLGLAELARDHAIFFSGALDLWVQGELDDDQFRAQVRHGGLVRLLAIDDADGRALVLRELAVTAPVVRAAALASRRG
jgi:AcrR family transcriptional regulator